MCPEFDARATVQSIADVDIRHWAGDFHGIIPADIVVEAFACHLPDLYVEAMARREAKPVWINLDYLSAEAWVSGCHALPSPHPRLPLTKYFFFPGFDETTGGLLRETGLNERREKFLASRENQAAFWDRLGQEPPATGTLRISLFAYENRALPSLLEALAENSTPICCLVPITRTQSAIEAFLGHTVKAGDVVHRGPLEIRLLPFVAQDEYDRLLWSCDLDFVRGEDSFVRVQWAAAPMLWHIYPQSDDAHRVKLDAFLDRYCADAPADLAELLRAGFLAWNGFGDFSSPLIRAWLSRLPEIRQHAVNWEKYLSKQQDLCTSLVRFCKSKL